MDPKPTTIDLVEKKADVPQAAPAPVPVHKKRISVPFVIGVIVLMVLLGGGIYWYFNSLAKPAPEPVVTPQISPVSVKPLPLNVTGPSEADIVFEGDAI